MKKAIVIYDTRFGNTEKIAKALARGLENKGSRLTASKPMRLMSMSWLNMIF